MKTRLCAAALLLALVATSTVVAGQFAAQVTMAPLGRAYSPPPLGRKQGWLVISNRDWMDYTLSIDYNDEKLYLYRQGQGWGSVHLPSGSTITIALEKDTWDLYGNSSEKLKVRIREGRTTTLSLEPFGYVGNTGLMGVVNDGNNIRNETLFNVYTQPVIVTPPPPAIIIEQPPPPPVIVGRPPRYRPHGYYPAPPPPPPPPPKPERLPGATEADEIAPEKLEPRLEANAAVLNPRRAFPMYQLG